MRFVGDGTAAEPARNASDGWWSPPRTTRSAATACSPWSSGRRAQVVGFGGLIHFAGRGEPEIKYALLRSAWGRGLATEAARALLGFAARTLGLQQVIATVDPDNHASQRVLAKAGMQRGALLQDEDGSWTQYFDWRAPEGDAG